jgi:hypothetical protein
MLEGGGSTAAEDLMSYLPKDVHMEVTAPTDAEYGDTQTPDELVRHVLGHDPWHRDAAALVQAGRMCSSPSVLLGPSLLGGRGPP